MTIYIECKMGIAGDMLMAALYELLSAEEQQQFLNTMNGLYPGSVHLHATDSIKCGVKGTHIAVHVHGTEETPAYSQELAHTHEHAHEHHSYASILEGIAALPLPLKVKEDASAVYTLLGNAEASVHATTLEQIHFHEVGSLDAIADVIGNCLLFYMLSPERVIFSPIHVGNGTVHCAHGVLPVPAPATAKLLQNIPYYTGEIASELCTPTGAALASHFANCFASMPILYNTTCGIGMGNKDFPCMNGVRAFMGKAFESSSEEITGESDHILEISCSVDDMTGEELGFAMEVLLDAGALDVFYVPIQMKKNRPGIMICCYCGMGEKDKFTQLFFQHTSTRGVRYAQYSRCKMTTHFENLNSPLGSVRRKINQYGDIQKSKLEYEDLRKLARTHNLTIDQVRKSIVR